MIRKLKAGVPNVWRNECLSVLMPILSVVIYKQQTEFRYADKKKHIAPQFDIKRKIDTKTRGETLNTIHLHRYRIITENKTHSILGNDTLSHFDFIFVRCMTLN